MDTQCNMPVSLNEVILTHVDTIMHTELKLKYFIFQ